MRGRPSVSMGWVNRRRDHGELVFVDLRDRSGTRPGRLRRASSFRRRRFSRAAKEIRSEFVLDVEGTVVAARTRAP